MKLMPRSVASDVVVFLADEAGFSLEQSLLDNLVASVAQGDRVSPLDVSICTLKAWRTLLNKGCRPH